MNLIKYNIIEFISYINISSWNMSEIIMGISKDKKLFDEYDEIRYMAEKAERVILEYLNTNKILHFKRKDLEDEFRGELSVSSIKNALRSMEERNILTSKGMTKDRTFTLIHTPENLTKSS